MTYYKDGVYCDCKKVEKEKNGKHLGQPIEGTIWCEFGKGH